MSILNPRRFLTPLGREMLLATLNADGPDAAFFAKQSHAVTEVTIDPVTKAVTAMTLGVRGLETNVAVGADRGTFHVGADKIIQPTALMTYTLTAGGDAQEIIGIVIGTAATAAAAMAFLEFDDPVSLDETSEAIMLAVEFGFDGQTFYMTPRVLPLGG